MAGKNDILATAGVDLSAFEAGIAKLTSRLDAVEKSGSRAASGIEKVDKSAKSLNNIVIADHFVNALGEIANNSGRATTALMGMDLSVLKNDFKELSEAGFRANFVLGKTFDVASRMPGVVGVAGQIAGAATEIMAEEEKNARAFSQEMNHAAISAEGLIQKTQRLTKVQTDEYKSLAMNQVRIDEAAKVRNTLGDAYSEQVTKQINLEKDLSAGGKQRLSIEMQSIKAAQEKADLEASFSIAGIVPDVNKKFVESGKSLIDQRLELEKKSLWFSEQQEASNAKLNELASVRGIKVQDQFSSLKAQSEEVEKQLALAEKLYGKNSATYLAMLAQRNALVNVGDELAFNVAQQNEGARLQTESLMAQIAGNKKLAALAENRAKFENQIREAQKAGLKEVAQALNTQQKLNELQIRALELLKTPKQKKEERDEQKKNDKAIRDAKRRMDNEEKRNAPRESELDKFNKESAEKSAGRTLDEMEKKGRAGMPGFDKLGNPLPEGSVGKIHGGKKAGDYESNETKKAVRDFIDRNKLPENENQGVKGMTDLIAKSLTINGIFKNAP